MISVFLWSFAPSDVTVGALGSFLAIFLGTLILEVFMPNDFLTMFYVCTTWCFNKVLTPEDSCPGVHRNFPRDVTAESIFGKPISTSSASFCCFSNIAFPEDGLLRFSFPTFPVKIAFHPFYFFYYIFNVCFWERERESTKRGGAEREGDTESEAGSRLWAVSTEPDEGLELTNREIMTWAEVGGSTDWTSQAPPKETFSMAE